MPQSVTQQHFDATVDQLRNELITKSEFSQSFDSFRSQMFTRFDEVIRFLSRLDQEQTFSQERFRRIESDVNRIKDHLKLA